VKSDPPFKARVLSVVRRIPPGRVASYGEVAAAAGKPRAARAVGNIMRDCGSRDVPCHRVIAAAGRLGGYGGNLELKRALLRAEGVLVSGNRVRDYRDRSAFAASRLRRDDDASRRRKARTNSRLRPLNQG
jgi:methylated-DNA-[protein]-cysteine S-methyltransferase